MTHFQNPVDISELLTGGPPRIRYVKICRTANELSFGLAAGFDDDGPLLFQNRNIDLAAWGDGVNEYAPTTGVKVSTLLAIDAQGRCRI